MSRHRKSKFSDWPLISIAVGCVPGSHLISHIIACSFHSPLLGDRFGQFRPIKRYGSTSILISSSVVRRRIRPVYGPHLDACGSFPLRGDRGQINSLSDATTEVNMQVGLRWVTFPSSDKHFPKVFHSRGDSWMRIIRTPWAMPGGW